MYIYKKVREGKGSWVNRNKIRSVWTLSKEESSGTSLDNHILVCNKAGNITLPCNGKPPTHKCFYCGSNKEKFAQAQPILLLFFIIIIFKG